MFIHLVFCTFEISVSFGCKSSRGPRAKKERTIQRKGNHSNTNRCLVCFLKKKQNFHQSANNSKTKSGGMFSQMEIPCTAELTAVLGITKQVLPAKIFHLFISGFSQKCHEPLKITPAYQQPKAVSAQMLRGQLILTVAGDTVLATSRDKGLPFSHHKLEGN